MIVEENSICYEGVCRCKTNYRKENNHCVIKMEKNWPIFIGEICRSDNNECETNHLHTECKNGICVCKNGFQASILDDFVHCLKIYQDEEEYDGNLYEFDFFFFSFQLELFSFFL